MMLSSRLARLKRERGLTTDALSRQSGIPKGTINKILNGETRNPTVGTLAALANALGCPLSSLCAQSSAPPEIAGEVPPASDPLHIPGVYRFGDGARWRDGLRNADDVLPVAPRRVPLLGEIAAGVPIYAEETLEGAECDAAMHCDFALRVHGDSMIGARIRDGDIVFIRRQDDVDDGQIAAVIVDDEATLKRVYHVKNGLQLLSENPKYPPMVFTLEEYGSIRILGLAVGFTSRL